jgi:hypothetical protein
MPKKVKEYKVFDGGCAYKNRLTNEFIYLL